MKKLLYSVLVAAMVLGLGGSALGAVSTIAPPPFSDIAGHEAEAELTLLAAMDIFDGGGAARPDDPITRAEFCKVVVLMMDRGSTAAGLAGLQPTFTDGASIPTWAWGYVNVAVYMGIIKGYADGSFGPSNSVTYAEAVTMLVRAVKGHLAAVPAGIWPYNFLFYGVDANFTGSVDVGFASLPCTRGDMARMVFATMKVDELKADGTVNKGSAVLVEGVNLFTCVANFFEDWEDPSQVQVNGYGDLTLAEQVYLVGGTDWDAFMNRPIIAVGAPVDPDDEGIFFIAADESRKVVTGIFDHFTTDEAGNSFVVLEDGTKVPYEEGALGGPFSFPVNLNHDVENDDWSLLPGDEVVCNVYDNGFIASVSAMRYDMVVWDFSYGDDFLDEPGWSVYGWDVVSAVDEATDESDTTIYVTGGGEYGTWCTFCGAYHGLDDEYHIDIPESTVVTLNGKPADRADLAEGDLVKVATYGAEGFYSYDRLPEDSSNLIIAVAATRQVAEGTVAGSRTVFPGETEYVTLKNGDVSKEYAFNSYGYAGLPAAAGKHQYLVGEDGKVFYDLLYETGLPYVIVTGLEVRTGEDTTYWVTGDNAGESQTYECTEAAADKVDGWIGQPVVLVVNGASGVVTDAYRWDSSQPWTVLAVGPDNVTVRDGGGTVRFLETKLVYKDATGPVATAYMSDAKYVGLAGLAVGDIVVIYWTSDGSGDHLPMLFLFPEA